MSKLNLFCCIEERVIKKLKLPEKALFYFLIPYAVILFSAGSSYAENIQNSTTLIKDEPKEDRTKLEWSISIQGRNFEEDSERLFGTKTALRVRSHYLLSPKLSLDAEIELRWFSDNAQLDLSEDYSTRPLQAREISVNYQPIKFLKFSLGNISQEFLNADLFMTKRAFPGLRQKLNWQKGSFDIGLIAQQTVPTAQSFNVDRSEREELPWFLTETLYAEFDFIDLLQWQWLSQLNLRLAGTYFQFNDLPAIAAEDGTRLGHISKNNTIGPNAQFRYDFEGYILDASFCFCGAEDTGVTLGGLWIDNLEAQSNDRAQRLYVGANTIWNEVRYGLEIENFFKDREVAPAVYGSLNAGGNNREGMIYRLSLESMKYKFRVVADYYDVGVISGNDGLQSDRQAVYIGLETAYVEF